MLTRQPPPPDFEWTAESIRSLRSHLGQSQAALARELGIRQQTVSEWETGMYKPRGASVTILTLLAVSSGFKFDQPETRENGHETATRPEPNGNGSSQRRQSLQPDAPAIRTASTHPDWVRSANGASHRGMTGAPRNFVQQPGGLGQRGPEIPM